MHPKSVEHVTITDPQYTDNLVQAWNWFTTEFDKAGAGCLREVKGQKGRVAVAGGLLVVRLLTLSRAAQHGPDLLAEVPRIKRLPQDPSELDAG